MQRGQIHLQTRALDNGRGRQGTAEVRRRGEGGPEVAEREYPAQRIGDKGRWQHERGGALREKRIQTSVDEAHIVAERQPAHHLRDLSHLEAFGDVLALVQQRPVGIEHALGGSRGAGGVLDEGRVIATRRPWLVAACGGGQDAVPTHQMRSRTVRAGWDLARQAVKDRRGGHNDGRPGVTHDSLETLDRRHTRQWERDGYRNEALVHCAQEEGNKTIISGHHQCDPIAGRPRKYAGYCLNEIPQLTVGALPHPPRLSRSRGIGII